MDSTVERMRDKDWGAVQAIYRDGLATGDATFETEAPGWKDWNDGHLRDCRLVAREEGQVVGWAALSAVSSRRVYGGVAEVSIYVAASARGRGVGKALLQALVVASEESGIWTLQASVFPENVPSILLHRACGFREVGVRERIGQMNGVWRDTILFERRSRLVGAGVAAREESRQDPMSRFIIRRTRIAHCKRGPSTCEKCREMNQERICLLDICAPDAGKMQRRAIQIDQGGEVVWREFDIVKLFESEDEAQEYAARHGIHDVEF